MSASAQGRGQAAGAKSTPVMKRGSHLVNLLPAAPSLCPPGDLTKDGIPVIIFILIRKLKLGMQRHDPPKSQCLRGKVLGGHT